MLGEHKLGIFESHAHYDDVQFDEDREQLLQQVQTDGVETIVNVAANLKGCEASIALAKKYPFIYASVGIHPDEVGELTEENYEALKKYALAEKVVAIGEIGLDYHWNNESHESQKKWFVKQLDLARALELPVIIHSRDAAKETLDIMKNSAIGIPGVVHCFSYSLEIAKEYLQLGYYLGIGGVITFQNAKKLKEVVTQVPLERILLETDCPYLAPVPNRGKRNSSLNLIYIATEIAKIKKVPVEEVICQTTQNAETMYQINR